MGEDVHTKEDIHIFSKFTEDSPYKERLRLANKLLFQRVGKKQKKKNTENNIS